MDLPPPPQCVGIFGEKINEHEARDVLILNFPVFLYLSITPLKQLLIFASLSASMGFQTPNTKNADISCWLVAVYLPLLLVLPHAPADLVSRDTTT